MFQKSCYSARVKYTGIVNIKTKVMIPLLNFGMQEPVVATEAHREEDSHAESSSKNVPSGFPSRRASTL